MKKEIINESLIYDELGISPIWLTLPKKVEVKKEQVSTKGHVFNLKKIELDNLHVLLVAPIFNLSNTVELELFKKISAYFDTLSNKLRQLQPIQITQESELASEIELCDHLIFLEQGLDKAVEKKNLTIPYISSVSLKEMVENPEKKRKLWQDIKELTKSIKQ